MKKACFLDRDGVLIEEEHYIDSPDKVRLIPGASDAIKLLEENGYLAIVASNQSGVARGMFDEESVKKVNARIDELLAGSGAAISAYYYCPHHKDGNISKYSLECRCRKPEPGMILQAAKDHSINLAESFMIGDKLSDLKAAENAGCKQTVLVKTGHGEQEAASPEAKGAIIAQNIKEAVKLLLKGNSQAS